jgi:hypothetical protein
MGRSEKQFRATINSAFTSFPQTEAYVTHVYAPFDVAWFVEMAASVHALSI